MAEKTAGCRVDDLVISIGYRLRWRFDIWRTDRGVAKVRSPGIRPATDDDIQHDAPRLLETVDQLLVEVEVEYIYFTRITR